MKPGELVTSIDLPDQDFSAHHTYLKLRDRLSYAFALVSVAVVMRIEDGAHRRGADRAGRGGAQAVAVEDGRGPAGRRNAVAFGVLAAAHALLEGAQGQGGNDFKIGLARRAIVRACRQAAAGTPQSQTDKRVA